MIDVMKFAKLPRSIRLNKYIFGDRSGVILTAPEGVTLAAQSFHQLLRHRRISLPNNGSKFYRLYQLCHSRSKSVGSAVVRINTEAYHYASPPEPLLEDHFSGAF